MKFLASMFVIRRVPQYYNYVGGKITKNEKKIFIEIFFSLQLIKTN